MPIKTRSNRLKWRALKIDRSKNRGSKWTLINKTKTWRWILWVIIHYRIIKRFSSIKRRALKIDRSENKFNWGFKVIVNEWYW